MLKLSTRTIPHLRQFPISFNSYYTTVTGKPLSDIAFVFDIDGVLIKGSSAIPQAHDTLNTLNSLKIPFILFTNGGGVTEASRCEYLSSKLQLSNPPLNKSQIVQSHTPIKTLINKHKRVLVVGGPKDNSRSVALNYGFEEVLRPIDIIKANPQIWPFHKYSKSEVDEWGLNVTESKVQVNGPNESIDSILVFNDPRDMGSDIQIIMDLLNSENGLIGTRRKIKFADHSGEGAVIKPSIPIIFSNNDFVWSNEFQIPRFGQGAFRIMVEELYSKMNNGSRLESLTLGKPFKVSYDYAHHILIDWNHKIANNRINDDIVLPELNTPPATTPFKKVYMVGDNPESDILGGNSYGWESILVRTGVYKDGDFDLNPKLAKPTLGIFDNVKDGVFKALKNHNLV